MDFLGARIQLNPRPLARRPIALEVGAIGHCPGRARVERLFALKATLDDIRQAGFGPKLDALITLVTARDSAIAAKATAKAIEKLAADVDKATCHLPIPLHSSAEFDDIFPLARTQPTQYTSLLAGDSAWLPQAVDDFFANGGEKLWLVRVPEAEKLGGFLPAAANLIDMSSLRGLACLLPINALALVIMPDLERLQIPARLPDVPRMQLANPEPVFLPLGTLLDDGHRERRNPVEIFADVPTQPLMDVLRPMLSLASKERPDLQFLFSLPMAYNANQASPGVDTDALAVLESARKSNSAHLLRQVQLVFPYLSLRDQLFSSVGVLAGAIAATAAAKGHWRSIAMQPLKSQAQPFPPQNIQSTIALRESPGVGVINLKAGGLMLDDERLLVPALHRDDYVLPTETGSYSPRLESLRSAEVVRFLGYLVRQLRELGERLIFNLDPEDPRPQILLEQFFLDLYLAGALRGSVPEEAFTITRASSQENVIAYDIQIAPAYPIDKIVITFINKDGEWQTGVSNG